MGLFLFIHAVKSQRSSILMNSSSPYFSSFVFSFRVMFITSESSISKALISKFLQKYLLIFGTFLSTFLGVLLALFDSKSLQKKLCHHYSNQDLEIFYIYQVMNDSIFKLQGIFHSKFSSL